MRSSISAWAPSHATLYFAVPENKEVSDLLHQGSLGGGLNFEEGVVTTVTISDNDRIFYNAVEIEGEISQTVLRLFRERTGNTSAVEVKHKSRITTGCGLSTSGAGSISLTLSLNELLGTQLDYIQCLQIAHEAEIICKTGLGSVLAQSVAGIEIRKSVGAPGIGNVHNIVTNDEIILIIIGPLSTKDVLTSEEKMKLVTQTGTEIHSKIPKNITTEEMIQHGKYFTIHCGLMTERVSTVLDDLKEIGEDKATMAMIGETIVVSPNDKNKVLSYCEKNHLYHIETRLSSKIPHLLT